MNEIEIRKATEEEIPLILNFIRGLAEYEKLSHEVIADEDTLRDSLFGDRPAAEVVIARLDGEPVGFALFFHNMSTFLGRSGLYLEDLFVIPSARGRGIGRALLSHLAQIAVERNCGRMEWAVLDWNRPAIEFYEKLNARPMSDWIVYRLTGDALNQVAASADSLRERG
jgi:GNAT superfamily N-acetyltransferase